MKKLLSVIMFIAVAGTLHAQITGVVINIRGGYDVVVETGRGQTVTVTADGYVADINMNGRVEYYDRFTTFERELEGKVRRVGNVDFEYYDDFGMNRQKAWKVKRIGSVEFDYYTDSFTTDRDRDGLLSRVGRTRFEYYDNFGSFNRGKNGLIRSIGEIRFDFYGDSDFFSSFDREHRWKTGLLKSIGNNRYDYFTIGANRPGGHGSGGHRPGSGYGQGRIRVSGPRTVRSGNVTIRVIEDARMPRDSFQ